MMHKLISMLQIVMCLLAGAFVSRAENQRIHEANHGTGDMLSMMALMGGNPNSMSVAEYNDHRDYDGSVDGHRSQFDWHIELDESHKYLLDWSVNYANNEVIFGLQVNMSASKFSRGSDIFALGFSSYGQLESSDFCIIWYDLGHRIHLQDARTDPLGKLKLVSESQSFCKLLYANSGRSKPWSDHNEEEYGGETGSEPADDSLIELARFKRPLDTCEESGYYRIDNGTTHLIWFTIKGPLLAIDYLDLSRLKSLSIHEHHHDSQRNATFETGLKRVQLVTTKPQRPVGKKVRGAKELAHDVRMDNYKIPNKETTYWCKLFKLPHKFEARKYHITSYEAVIETGNEHIVHHMELFSCSNLSQDQELELSKLSESGWSGDCSGPSRPAATEPCRKVIMAWAMGAHPLEYPEQVGQAIGGHGQSPYVMLEVHYNNVQLQGGLLDSSGLRFHYSSKLRPFDAGVLEVGLEYTDKNSIPPKMITPIAGYCHSECTRVAMSQGRHLHHKNIESSSTGEEKPSDDHTGADDGIYIFAAQMHTHLVGVASWTEQVREGRVIGELQRDNHYSPHFQEIRLLPVPIHLAPGDALVHYCLYDTRKRVNMTLGGFATSDEMCVTYLHYYPRIDLEVCKSSIDSGALSAYFAHLNEDESQPTSGSGPVSDNYRVIEWSPRRGKELLEFYNRAPLSIQCNKSDGQRHPGHWNGISPTSTWRPEELFGEHAVARPSGDELAAYRGRDASLFEGRHAQCAQTRSRYVERR